MDEQHKKYLIEQACLGDESARVELEEAGVWEASKPIQKTNDRLCNCGSGLTWVECPGQFESAGHSYCG